MVRTRRLRIVAMVAAAACVAAAPSVAAQAGDDHGDGGDTSTTSTTSTSTTSTTTSTTTPRGSTSTTTTSTTTTTTPYIPPIPPDLVDDPRLPFLIDPGPGDGIDIPVAQLPFDPATISVLPERVAAAEEALTAAQRALHDIQDQIAGHSATVRELSDKVRALDTEVRRAVEAAARARKELRDHAVAAYMVGPVEDHLALLNSGDAVDMGVAKSYLDVVASTRERLVRQYEEKRRGLSSGHGKLAADLGDADSELAAVSAELPAAFDAVREASDQLAAYEAGAHAYVEGFVFPVAGNTEFIDSWGFPRMLGTTDAHWHQGTDIFAAAGTPLVASENGVLDRVGSASLGGNKLWVNGESGHRYYYAHLSSFAEGVANGKPVRAGEVIGYVGDTGNARGTSPHLHFEIHPQGRGPANPYPLLKAAYGARPVAPAVAPTTTAPPAPPVPAPAGPPAPKG